MEQNKVELIATFAKLWGMTTVDDFRDKKEIYRELESYDSEELTNLLSSWADEFFSGEHDDTCDFFDEKMSSLISSFTSSIIANKYPVLYGYAGETTKELRGIQEVAQFIVEYGLENDIVITREGHVFFLSTFGIYINRIVDLEYREELLKVLAPMQQAIDGSGKL